MARLSSTAPDMPAALRRRADDDDDDPETLLAKAEFLRQQAKYLEDQMPKKEPIGLQPQESKDPSLDGMTVVVTGANGEVGSVVTEELLQPRLPGARDRPFGGGPGARTSACRTPSARSRSRARSRRPGSCGTRPTVQLAGSESEQKMNPLDASRAAMPRRLDSVVPRRRRTRRRRTIASRTRPTKNMRS